MMLVLLPSLHQGPVPFPVPPARLHTGPELSCPAEPLERLETRENRHQLPAFHPASLAHLRNKVKIKRKEINPIISELKTVLWLGFD